MEIYLTLAGIYVLASAVQGLTAFGFSVISVPIVAALTTPTTAIAYNLVIATVVAAQKAIMMRKRLNVRWTLFFALAILPFVPLGVLYISRISREAALASMGVYVILAAALQLARYAGIVGRVMRTRVAYWVSAGLTGLLAGAFSAPGPASVPFFVARHEDPLAGQANLSLFFSTLIVPVLGLHMLIGELRPVQMLPGFFYVPVAMVATWFSTRLAHRMNSGLLRRIVAGAMVLMGVYLVLTSVLSL